MASETAPAPLPPSTPDPSSITATAHGAAALHVEELEDFVLKLDEAVATEGGEVPPEMTAQLLSYASQVRPMLAASGGGSPAGTPSRRGSAPRANRSIDAQIKATEALAQRRILSENREEAMRETKMREVKVREERLRRQRERDERVAERKAAARLKQEAALREREELRRTSAAAMEQRRRDDEAARARTSRERAEARKSVTDLRTAQKAMAAVELAGERAAMGARMSRSQVLEEEARARKATLQAAAREKSELRKREREEQARTVRAAAAADKRERQVELERDAAWKLVLEAKKKSAALLKDVIKNDVSHTVQS